MYVSEAMLLNKYKLLKNDIGSAQRMYTNTQFNSWKIKTALRVQLYQGPFLDI